MLNYEEAGNVLDELLDELPEGMFRDLNGGISLIEESQKSDDGRFTLGTYFHNGMGRYIELYYGSFTELYGEMDDEKFRERLKKTLHHELTHHIENMAGDRSLENWDERNAELYGFGDIDVKSILFVDSDGAILSPFAAAIFDSCKAGRGITVPCAAACISEPAEPNKKALKAAEEYGAQLPEAQTVSRELIEAHSVVLTMSYTEAEELSKAYQDLDERIMCLAEDDIVPPTLAVGWKRVLERLYDEVLAVIDELCEEDA